MERRRTNKIQELYSILNKMPVNIFCTAALPEFGVQWREVAKSVRNARLPMQPSSIARVMCKHISEALSSDETKEIVARLRLKLLITRPRTWHVLRLSEPTRSDELLVNMINELPCRIMLALQKKRGDMKPEVQMVLVGDLIYLSIQLVSQHKEGSTLYVATPPGAPVALVSSTSMAGLLKGCVAGLGYKKYENANLYGQDIISLLRINDNAWHMNTIDLREVPEYEPVPVVSKNCIDFTYRQYDDNYVDQLLGPEPLLITDFKMTMTKHFFDRHFLDKPIKLSIGIKSQDIGKTLKNWVRTGAIAPTSDFFRIFKDIKSNNIRCEQEDSD